MKRLVKNPFCQIFALLIVLTSCEEVIHLELTDSPTRVVIDATLNASLGGCQVILSNTLGFYESDSITKISGAKVELISNSNLIIPLPEVKPGFYFANGLTVDAGEVLSLRVTLPSGDVFMAKTEVPVRVPLDRLLVIRGYGSPVPNSPPVFLINPQWKDPAGTTDYYRLKVSKNGKVIPGSFSINNDKPFNGSEVNMPLDKYVFQLGDTVRLEFQCIDSVSYAYFDQINDMAQPGFVSATPYNPIGNFDKGALGYFGIFYSEIWNTIMDGEK